MRGVANYRREEDRDGWSVMDAGLREAVRQFGGRIEAAFAIGSLAHGGFASAASDVDLALILSDLQAADGLFVRDIQAAVRDEVGSALARRLSVFWSTWESLGAGDGQGRFPLADRQDLVASGICLLGNDQRRLANLPAGLALGDALVIEGAGFMRDKLVNDHRNQLLRSPDALVALGCREVTKAVLFPARFLLTLVSHGVAENEAAATYVAATYSEPVALLVTAAYRARVTGEFDTAAMTQLLKAGLLPLYGEMTTRYADRLQTLGKVDLAKVMLRWRQDLGA